MKGPVETLRILGVDMAEVRKLARRFAAADLLAERRMIRRYWTKDDSIRCGFAADHAEKLAVAMIRAKAQVS